MASEAPVFSSATDIGSMAAINTMLSQLIVRYASSTLRRQPHNTIRTAAINTAATAGTQLNTMAAIISSIMPAARGALCVRVTLEASARGWPTTTHSKVFLLRRAISVQVP